MMKMFRPNLRSKGTWLSTFAAILILALVAAVGFQIWYSQSLKPVSNSGKSQLFSVDEGSSAKQIASGLKSLGLIRNYRAFLIYINSKNYRSQLQAGTYKFSPSMSAQEIATKLATGDIDKNWLTILPGKRLDQIKQAFIRDGYTSNAVDGAFDPSNYPNTVASLGIPKGSSLEGFLYPDSFQRDINTPASALIQESLNEMAANLTDDIKNGFSANGLSTFQGVTLASIVVQESGDPSSQHMIAQVFLSRLKQDMALGSDVTAFYASALAHQTNSVSIDSPYNTRINKGLPPGPIGSVTKSALLAVAHPATTDYLFFVAGDDGTIHFSHTEAEHEAAVAKYCKKLCQ